jgi:hypothetical protein
MSTRVLVFLGFLVLSVVLTLLTGQLFFFLVLPFAFVWPWRKGRGDDPAGEEPPT